MPTYYDPFKELQTFVNQALTTTKSLAMPMDLYRCGDTYRAELDLPGVDPASIDIDVEDRSITIRAERKASRVSKGDEWISRERSFGTYARQITVGSGLALDRITAEYTDGVLELTIPVAAEARPRKVQVQRGAGGRRLEGDITSTAEDITPEQAGNDQPAGDQHQGDQGQQA